MCKRYIHLMPPLCSQLGTWPTTQACAQTGNRTSDLLVHRLVLNPLSHVSQGEMYSFFGIKFHEFGECIWLYGHNCKHIEQFHHPSSPNFFVVLLLIYDNYWSVLCSYCFAFIRISCVWNYYSFWAGFLS